MYCVFIEIQFQYINKEWKFFFKFLFIYFLGLFSLLYMVYEIECDKIGNGEFLLLEMMLKVINIFKRNKDKGFFLLVEGKDYS